jgi:hypothetical protein
VSLMNVMLRCPIFLSIVKVIVLKHSLWRSYPNKLHSLALLCFQVLFSSHDKIPDGNNLWEDLFG